MNATRLHFLFRIVRIAGSNVGRIAGVAALLIPATTFATAPLPNDGADQALRVVRNDSAQLSYAEVRAALDSIDPEPLVMAANTALEMAAMQNDNVMQRIGTLRSGARGAELAGLHIRVDDWRITDDAMNAVLRPTLGRFLDGALSGPNDVSRLGLFMNGNVRIGKSRGTGPAADDNIGLTTGIDYRLRENLALGASVGYSSGIVESDPSRGVLEIESWRGTLFGTYYAKDYFHVDGLLAYGNNAYDSLRRIDNGDVQALAQGATSGRQVSGEVTSAFDLRHGPWVFGPHLGARFFDVDVARLDEVGAGDYDLTVGVQHAKSTRVNAGARLAVAFRVPWGVVLTPHVNADYVHDLDDGSAAVSVSFLNDPLATNQFGPTPAVELHTDQPEAGYFVWSVGASAQLARVLSGFVNYRSFAGADNFTSNELTCGVRFETRL